MIGPLDQLSERSTVHTESIHVMAEAECNILYGSQKKVKMVEEGVLNVYQQIIKQSCKQFYIIADYKILMEVSRGTGYILSMWLQDQFYFQFQLHFQLIL